MYNYFQTTHDNEKITEIKYKVVSNGKDDYIREENNNTILEEKFNITY